MLQGRLQQMRSLNERAAALGGSAGPRRACANGAPSGCPWKKGPSQRAGAEAGEDIGPLGRIEVAEAFVRESGRRCEARPRSTLCAEPGLEYSLYGSRTKPGYGRKVLTVHSQTWPTFSRPARAAHPFGLGRQPSANELAIGVGVVPAHVPHRLVVGSVSSGRSAVPCRPCNRAARETCGTRRKSPAVARPKGSSTIGWLHFSLSKAKRASRVAPRRPPERHVPFPDERTRRRIRPWIAERLSRNGKPRRA